MLPFRNYGETIDVNMNMNINMNNTVIYTNLYFLRSTKYSTCWVKEASLVFTKQNVCDRIKTWQLKW